ncbi:MAG: T9SS type A sorting domain-containing protein [Bacteroidia bacterium]|nr:T9SS type A sorting domain-containing protein [Bacteroidia bacterium]
MKNIFTLLVLLFTLFIAKAQPTITSNVLPIKGDTILMSLDSVLVPPGNSGANVSWDFSTSIKQDIFIERVYLDPANTPYAAKFPNAKLCRTDGIGSVYSFWDNSNAAKSIYYGFVEKNIYDQNYNALPLSYYKFPITYGQSFTDSISALTNPGALVGPGKYIFNADGWGSLKLPNKTVPNVLRTKSLIYIGDSNPPVNSYSLTIEYAWYQAFKKEPLLVISSVVIDHVLHKKFIIFDNSLVVGVNETKLTNNINLYPNPATDKLFIEFTDLNENTEIEISIFDAQGKEQKHLSLLKSDFSNQIDISNLTVGMYFINGRVGDKYFNKKITKTE